MALELIPRDDLVARLDAATGLALVIAAPGYGKSELLTQLQNSSSRPVHRLLAAADTADDILEAVATLLTDPLSSAIVCVDDAHTLGTSALATLVGLPRTSGTLLIVSARGIEPSLLVTLRLQPRVIEIDETLLRFSPAQIAALAEDFDAEAAARVGELTHGWPAGVRLCVLRLARDPESAVLETVDPAVTDYLRYAVLPSLPAGVRHALTTLAHLSRIEPALARELVADPAVIDEILAGHLFLTRRRDQPGTFIWVETVRRSLAALADEDDPSQARRIWALGAQYSAERGWTREAIHLHLRAGESAQALPLLREQLIPLFSRGGLTEVVGIIRAIDPDLAGHSVGMSTMLAYAGVMTGDVVCATRWAASATELLQRQDAEDVDEEVAYLTLRAHMALGGAARMREDATRAVQLAAHESLWRPVAVALRGTAAILAGDLDAAAPALVEAAHVAEEHGTAPALTLALGERALISMARGNADVDARIDAAVQSCLGLPHAQYPHAALPYALDARRRAERGDVEGARAQIARVNALRPSLGAALPWLGMQVRRELAVAAAAIGEHELARVASWEADRLELRVFGVAPGASARLSTPPPPPVDTVDVLSPAERRVLPFLATHLSYAQIGLRLNLSRNTVKTQVSAVYRKLGVGSRARAVEVATSMGLLSGSTNSAP